MTNESCWICGGPRATAEHRIKKSDLVRQYGQGPYRGQDVLFHYRGDRTQLIQGPNTEAVKYAKNLCAQCNNTFTQPFDRAYEEFIDWAMQHRQDIIARRVIDFESVYGQGWEDKQRDLFKYFAKCFGCRLDEADRVVPEDVVNLLSESEFQTGLWVTFMVNEDVHELGIDHVATEPLIVHRERSSGQEVGFQSGHAVGWLTMMYWYQHYPLDPVGARGIADSKHVYLGWYRPLGTRAR